MSGGTFRPVKSEDQSMYLCDFEYVREVLFDNVLAAPANPEQDVVIDNNLRLQDVIQQLSITRHQVRAKAR